MSKKQQYNHVRETLTPIPPLPKTWTTPTYHLERYTIRRNVKTINVQLHGLRGTGKLTHMHMRMLVLFLIVMGIVASLAGCEGNAQVGSSIIISYKFPIIPITFTFDTNGHISFGADLAHFVTELGEITVSAGVAPQVVPLNSPVSGNLLRLTIRHKQDGNLVDSSYQINTGGEGSADVQGNISEVKVGWNGNNNSIFINASNGDITSIVVEGAPPPATAAAPATVVPTNTPTPIPTPTPTPSPTSIELGGLDLNGYCQSFNDAGVSLDGTTARDWHCVQQFHDVSINMTDACDWQYHRSDLHAHTDNYNDPNSWACFTSQNAVVGGLDLDGYCKSHDYAGVSLDGTTARDWHCIREVHLNINMIDACRWQYKRSDVVAITDNYGDPNSWNCYTSS